MLLLCCCSAFVVALLLSLRCCCCLFPLVAVVVLLLLLTCISSAWLITAMRQVNEDRFLRITMSAIALRDSNSNSNSNINNSSSNNINSNKFSNGTATIATAIAAIATTEQKQINKQLQQQQTTNKRSRAFNSRLVWITFQCYNFSAVAVFTVIYSRTVVNGQCVATPQKLIMFKKSVVKRFRLFAPISCHQKMIKSAGRVRNSG